MLPYAIPRLTAVLGVALEEPAFGKLQDLRVQPLCYAHDLMMENCTMADDCDLAFEYSSVQATINSSIRSVKNPRTGSITAESYGEVILDENIKARVIAN